MKLLNLRAEKLLQRVSEVLWYVHEVVRICTPKHRQCFQSILSPKEIKTWKCPYFIYSWVPRQLTIRHPIILQAAQLGTQSGLTLPRI